MELEFPRGITAFVGANGSGKSNIVDAIRWCLGEQNTRDLRGQRAEDVIHAGKRRVLGSAEVVLTFEAEQMHESELQIARRLMRSGESDYLINGSRRRLKDVQGALSSLGMDHPRFVVVTQGMTDFLLSATAAERRALLEQAAGLSSYRQRRDDASGKLALAEQNMLAAEVVLAELEPRIRSLQRQVRAIEARDELVARLHTRQTIWYAVRRRDIHKALDEAERRVVATEAERRAARRGLDALEHEAERSLEREREWQRRVEVASAALHLAQRELDANAHRMATARVHMADAERARSGIRRRLTELAGEVDRARERRAQAAAEWDRASQELEKAREAEAAAGQHLESLRSRLSDCSRLADEAQREAAQHFQASSALAGRRRRLELELEEVELRLTRLSGAEGEMSAALVEVREKVKDAESDVQAAGNSLRVALEHLERQSGVVRRAEEKVTRAQALRSAVTAGLHSARARREALERSYQALKRQMAGTVFDLLTVEPAAERAVNIALGPWRTGFAPADNDFSDFLRWRATLADVFPREAVWADCLARADTPIPALLYATIVVPTLRDAEYLWEALAARTAHQIGSPPVQIATRDGSLISASGRRVESDDDSGARYFALRSDVSAVEREVERLTRNDRRLQPICDRLRVDLAEYRSGLVSAQAESDQARKTLTHAEAELHSLQARAERLARDLDDSRHATSSSTARRDQLTKELEESAAQLGALNERLADAEESSTQAETAVGSARADVESARRAVAEIAEDVGILSRRAEAQHELVQAAELEEKRLRAEPSRLETELGAAEAALERLSAELGELQHAEAELAAASSEREKHLAEVRVDRPKSAELGSELRAARQISDEALTAHERAVARRDEILASRDRLEREIMQEMGSEPVADLGIIDGDVPTEEEIRRLRARAAQYADYDPSILAEYRELTERRDYLTTQILDLRATADGLREVMSLADAEMRVRFADALARVAGEYDRVFSGMVNGGQAGLEQTEDGGIEVRASLPGKRTRSIAWFSGGERALVASALLFGVLSIRPAPFCVLDEVDAALDEANVDRYLQALSDLSGRMQILVVTHNRATMAAATALYGLTMDSEGASSLLSLRLDEYEAVS